MSSPGAVGDIVASMLYDGAELTKFTPLDRGGSMKFPIRLLHASYSVLLIRAGGP